MISCLVTNRMFTLYKYKGQPQCQGHTEGHAPGVRVLNGRPCEVPEGTLHTDNELYIKDDNADNSTAQC